MTAEIQQHDFLVLGRTEQAFATHPLAQRETERLITHVFGLAFGEAWDVAAGSRGLSSRAAGMLLARAKEPSVGSDAEWPLILQRFPHLRLGYRATKGLEFETADRYTAGIAAEILRHG